MPDPILAFRSVSKLYRRESGEILKALDEVSFRIEPGKKLASHGAEREREIDAPPSRRRNRRAQLGDYFSRRS